MAEGRTATYAELHDAAMRTARRLAAAGIGEGHVVATTLPAGHAFAHVLHAAPLLGAVFAPLDPRSPTRVEARLVVESPLGGAQADTPLRERVDPDATHSLVHTSGTTGEPTRVELTYGNHHASATGSAELLGAEADDSWLCPLPLHHVGGLAVLLRSAIHGTTALVQAPFDAATARAALESGDVTLASLVPTMLQRLREAGLSGAPRVRAILLGGGPADDALVAWAIGAGLPLRLTYGMTEAASQVATAEPGERAARPLPGTEVAIAGDGEILVRGPTVASGALGVDGWLHTGDLGSLDDQGRLHVQGRKKELIVTGGENVSPLEVEAVLMSHPAVDDAAVAGMPDLEWGEAVTAYVVAGEGAGDAELLEHCRERLEPFKVPKRIVRRDSLPRNAAGKLQRSRL